jgi:nucleoside-triphosphatase THEP1
MFGLDLFDVIDLTDKSKLITISKERSAPSIGKYKIRDEVIEINPKYSFRIVDLSKDTLILYLILNFENKDVSIKGEALEMKFIQMKKLE